MQITIKRSVTSRMERLYNFEVTSDAITLRWVCEEGHEWMTKILWTASSADPAPEVPSDVMNEIKARAKIEGFHPRASV